MKRTKINRKEAGFGPFFAKGGIIARKEVSASKILFHDSLENTSPMKSESQMRVTSQHDSTPTRTKRSSRSPSFSGNNRQKVIVESV